MMQRMRTPSGVRAIRPWPAVFCTAALAALVPAPAAHAACSTSSDGLTRTCTGDITGPESFNNLDVRGTHTYTFVLENLTSTGMISEFPGIPAIEFLNSTHSFTNGTAGYDGASQVFELHLDSAAGGFLVGSAFTDSVEIQTAAGSGGTNGEKQGSGTQRGSNGGAGGYGGATTISATDTTITTGSGGQPLLITTMGGNGRTGAEGRSSGSGDGFGVSEAAEAESLRPSSI